MKQRPFTNIGRQVPPSPAEQKVADLLKALKLRFYREVMFPGCINPYTLEPLRYDFYIPKLDLIVEYDGKDYHAKDDVKRRDAIKTKFAKENGFAFLRVAGYTGLEANLCKIIKGINPDSAKLAASTAKVLVDVAAANKKHKQKKVVKSYISANSSRFSKLPAAERKQIIVWHSKHKT